MELVRKEVEDIVIISFEESTILDDTNAARFKTKLMGILGEGKSVLIDFSNMNLISSSGMGALVAISALANEKKVKFGFYGLSTNLMNLFKVTKLYMIFKIFKDQDEAMDAFAE